MKGVLNELARFISAPGAAAVKDLLSSKGTVPIPLGAITQEDGTALLKQATTVAGYSQLANKETVILIPVDATKEALGFSVALPNDLDATQDVTIHVIAGKAADLDALTLDAEAYPVGVGDAANADIQDTAALALTQSPSELVFTCGSDGVIAPPSALSVVLTLGGTNDGDATYIYAVWLEYTKLLPNA